MELRLLFRLSTPISGHGKSRFLIGICLLPSFSFFRISFTFGACLNIFFPPISLFFLSVLCNSLLSIRSGRAGPITYQYTPYLLTTTSFKLYEEIPTGPPLNYRLNRTLLNKHGVKIDLVQSGSLASFSFPALLVSLTTSLTLLAVATVIVDYVALYLMPDKIKYSGSKYEWTEDFSDMRAAEKAKNRGRSGSRASSVSVGGDVGGTKLGIGIEVKGVV